MLDYIYSIKQFFWTYGSRHFLEESKISLEEMEERKRVFNETVERVEQMFFGYQRENACESNEKVLILSILFRQFWGWKKFIYLAYSFIFIEFFFITYFLV